MSSRHLCNILNTEHGFIVFFCAALDKGRALLCIFCVCNAVSADMWDSEWAKRSSGRLPCFRWLGLNQQHLRFLDSLSRLPRESLIRYLPQCTVRTDVPVYTGASEYLCEWVLHGYGLTTFQDKGWDIRTTGSLISALNSFFFPCHLFHWQEGEVWEESHLWLAAQIHYSLQA